MKCLSVASVETAQTSRSRPTTGEVHASGARSCSVIKSQYEIKWFCLSNMLGMSIVFRHASLIQTHMVLILVPCSSINLQIAVILHVVSEETDCKHSMAVSELAGFNKL